MNSSRRAFLQKVVLGAGAVAIAGSFPRWAFAEELVRTPRQTEGPFYPDKLPLDTDNDLLIINDAITPAVGEVTHLTGRILDANGNPVNKAVIEIWQVDGHGIYLHSDSEDREDYDKNFQGFGRFETASAGEYRFRTIKPVSYPGRTPHIHVKVKLKDKDVLVTQLYIKGERQNARDGILNSIRDKRQRESVIVDFTPVKDSKIGELAASFDIVLGITPQA